MTSFLATAFLLGLTGSLHCVGMCGPLALALPYRGASKWVAAGNVLSYNLGRVVTYSLIGLMIGLVGQSLELAGLQVYFSVGIGVLFILAALMAINLEQLLVKVPTMASLNAWVKRKLAQLLAKPKSSTYWRLGMMNGLLPCGLVYLAVAGAVATGSLVEGASYMALFGLGTLPLMMATALVGQFIPIQWRNQIKRLTPVVLLLFGCLLIARGLHFELPDQMRFWEIGQEVPVCH